MSQPQDSLSTMEACISFFKQLPSDLHRPAFHRIEQHMKDVEAESNLSKDYPSLYSIRIDMRNEAPKLLDGLGSLRYSDQDGYTLKAAASGLMDADQKDETFFFLPVNVKKIVEWTDENGNPITVRLYIHGSDMYCMNFYFDDSADAVKFGEKMESETGIEVDVDAGV